jgi:hypothetical protein
MSGSDWLRSARQRRNEWHQVSLEAFNLAVPATPLLWVRHAALIVTSMRLPSFASDA